MGLFSDAQANIQSRLKDARLKRDAAKFERLMEQINKTGVDGARICFLDAFPSHYQFSKHTIEKLALTHPVTLLVFDKEHPAHRSPPKNVKVFLIDSRWRAFALQWLRIPYLVTPASHLHPSSVRPDLKTIHSYHSLVSMHAVYGDDAFDTYTHFLACGPYHVEEVHAIKKARGLPPATVFNVGYPKLDELAATYATKARQESNRKTILLAPSWHPANLLKTHAAEICRAVVNMGHNLIVRPHPHLFERDTETMAILRSEEAGSGGCMKIENPHTQFDSFWTSDAMVCDWSGVAFEFAFATERPVIFVDAPRKAPSVDLLKLDIPLTEDVLRSEVGVIVDSVDQLASGIQSAFLSTSDQWSERIRNVRDRYIFNFRSSATEGAGVLSALADHAELLPPTDNSRDRLVELIRYYS